MFSSDGRYLATVALDGVITIRDAETFEPISKGFGALASRPCDFAYARCGVFTSAANLQNMAFSDDGRHLVTVLDEIVQLWLVATGEPVGEPFPNDVGFIPATLAGPVPVAVTAVGDDLLIWNLDVDSWFDIACQAAGRNMTRDEWDRFGPRDEPYHATCPQWPAAA